MPEAETTKVYQTLEALIANERDGILNGDGKQRAYSVTTGKQTVYVVSNSQGNAALATCTVETVKQKDIMAAALRCVPDTPKDEES